MNKIANAALVATALMLTSCGSGTASNISSGEDGEVIWPSDIVSETGAISFPQDFLKWQTLGAWSTADENGKANGMHQVYISPRSVNAYLESGTFPDGTVLVKEVRGAATAALSTGAASYATDKGVWFVMIKDVNKRFPDNSLWGDGWGWALFEAKDPTKQVATDYKQDCLSCHVPAEATDWIYIEAYPVLWKDGKPPIPTWLTQIKASMDEKANEEISASAEEPVAFAVCKTCHSIETGKNGIGPSLAGIVGRNSGTVSGYSYSPALKSANIVWTEENLDSHITKPSSVVPGNKMESLFPGGVAKPSDRRAIIDYLKTT
jgi:cytochrome c